jgi:predicted Zn-dependent protease
MLDDDQFRTLMILGHLFRRLGLSAKCERLYAALMAERPAESSLLAPAAAAALACDHPQDALAFLDRLRNAEPPQAVHWLLRAQALSSLGREDEAHEAAEAYLGARLLAEAGK